MSRVNYDSHQYSLFIVFLPSFNCPEDLLGFTNHLCLWDILVLSNVEEAVGASISRRKRRHWDFVDRGPVSFSLWSEVASVLAVVSLQQS